MGKTRANLGLDLHLDLTGTRVRAALERALRVAVRDGRLREGARLPSSRALAKDLGIARNTVADAYGQLVAEGWLVARQGSGTRVAGRTAAPEVLAGTASETPPTTWGYARADPGGGTRRGSQDATRPGLWDDRWPGPLGSGLVRYDLRPGSPDLSAFPRAAWLAAARRALSSAPGSAFGYPDPRGRIELRRAVAEYLARTRGVRAEPERIVICAGFTHSLSVLCQVLRARGVTRLAVEAYGQPGHRDIVTAAGLELTTIPVDAHGAVVAALAGGGSSARRDDAGRDEASQCEVGAVLLTPPHQFPLGMPLAAGRRTDAIQWALDSGGLVIEDDYDGEFRYDRQPLGAMQAFAPEHVVYAGTASKALAPGLRLGWLMLPARLAGDVAATSALIERPASSLDQLTLAEFITSGAYDSHVRHARLSYRRRRDRLVTELARQVPQTRVIGIAAGLHAVIELPSGQDEDAVVEHARRRGLAIDGLGAYSALPSQRGPALVAGYGTPPDHAFTGAVARLCLALADPDDT
jgi:GntR family transcriptional regulator/MocR family aminotransferase